jgi:predicted CoA-binding protein
MIRINLTENLPSQAPSKDDEKTRYKLMKALLHKNFDLFSFFPGKTEEFLEGERTER